MLCRFCLKISFNTAREFWLAFGAGSNYFTVSQFKALTLYTDLFTTLNVSQLAFFLGAGPWANIPRFVSKGNIS